MTITNDKAVSAVAAPDAMSPEACRSLLASGFQSKVLLTKINYNFGLALCPQNLLCQQFGTLIIVPLGVVPLSITLQLQAKKPA